MKKAFLKGTAFGCALTIALGAVTAVSAEAVRKQIYAVYNDIKIVVDGTQITPKDGNGNLIQPFISEGTTYLPVRAVANAVGKNVSWDASSYTVYIGEIKKTGAIDMSTLEAYSGYDFEKGGEFEVRQQKITSMNYKYSDPNHKEYADSTYILDGKYKEIKGEYAVSDDSPWGGGSLYFLNADTDELIAEYTNEKGEKPIKVNVDLVGVDKLKIYVNTGYFYNAFIYPI